MILKPHITKQNKMKKLYFLCTLASMPIATSTFAQYTKLLDFAGATNGSLPFGSLTYEGTFLYGMTRYGGTNEIGTVFFK